MVNRRSSIGLGVGIESGRWERRVLGGVGWVAWACRIRLGEAASLPGRWEILSGVSAWSRLSSVKFGKCFWVKPFSLSNTTPPAAATSLPFSLRGPSSSIPTQNQDAAPPSSAKPTPRPAPPRSRRPAPPSYSDGSPPLLRPRELEKNHSSTVLETKGL
ncbi:hypothetical protein FH972_009173 [Carpinus fangiana]|uniref:Uncharacterized protein n=1 Tax=Carpinus fangiana TaxID=176857 RepID=A0A5N6R115_9ROSI|nr:hypothetical protein FH972_009173 [Carpinus fangiana]